MELFKNWPSIIKEFINYPAKVQIAWFLTLIVIIGWILFLTSWSKEKIEEKNKKNTINQNNSKVEEEKISKEPFSENSEQNKQHFEKLISESSDLNKIKQFIENHKTVLNGAPQELAGKPLIEDLRDFPIQDDLVPNFTRFNFQSDISQIVNFIIFLIFYHQMIIFLNKSRILQK